MLRLLVPAMFVPLILLAPSRVLADDPKVSYLRDKQTGQVIGERWYIYRPDVNVAKREYPDLQYRYGDLLFVEAGGCVQTGGIGKTCKLYVDPKDDSTDKYHGLIWLPGAPGKLGDGLVRISQVKDTPTPIKIKPPHGDDSAYHLWLGYEDDDYTDNGYYAMDKGTHDQCNGAGWAWVRITVTYNKGFDVDTGPILPMDLWWDEIDDNLLPLNPKWGLQVTKGILPDAHELCGHFQTTGVLGQGELVHTCTQWSPTVDTAGDFNFICNVGTVFSETIHGHINWGFATYQGRIRFSDFSGGWPHDGDYNMELIRDDQAGVTTGNTYRVENGLLALDLEFDSAETIDYFDMPWWRDFHRKVDDEGSKADELVHDREAIVIGLLGLDNQHGAKAELHPVFGLAIHTKAEGDEDVWQIFARNSGNEGSCSQNQHFFPQNKVSFFFKDTVAVLSGTEFHANVTEGTSWGEKVVTGEGVLVTFYLPEPTAKAVIHGELHLKRKSRAIKNRQVVDKYQRYRHLLRSLSKEEEGTTGWKRIIERLDRGKQSKFLVEADRAYRAHRESVIKKSFVVPKAKGNRAEIVHKKLGEKDKRVPTKENSTSKELEPFDQKLEERRLQMLQYLEEAVGNNKDFEALMRSIAVPQRHGVTGTASRPIGH